MTPPGRLHHPGTDTPDPARIVLDTNVCLDLLLFADPKVAQLASALRTRRVIAMASAATRAEWQRVLGYPALRLDSDRRSSLSGAFDALVDNVAIAAESHVDPQLLAALPRCVDPDDQKFLELARTTGARWLLSRDQDLLQLAARCRRDGHFVILTPQDWADAPV